MPPKYTYTQTLLRESASWHTLEVLAHPKRKQYFGPQRSVYRKLVSFRSVMIMLKDKIGLT